MAGDVIKRIECSDVPGVAGPYSQALSAGDYVFVSGQIPVDPRTGEIIRGDIGKQTLLVIENVRRILNSQDLGLDRVVKVEVFLADLNDFEEMNKAYASVFKFENRPARQVVQVARLPKDVDIELSCIAYK